MHLHTSVSCRRWILERKLAASDVSKDEQLNLLKDLERKETEFIRLRRQKICPDDFELLTIIGRGAFGEVCSSMDNFPCNVASLLSYFLLSGVCEMEFDCFYWLFLIFSAVNGCFIAVVYFPYCDCFIEPLQSL